MVVSLGNYELAALTFGLLVTLVILQRRKARAQKEAVKDLTIQRLVQLLEFANGNHGSLNPYGAGYNGLMLVSNNRLCIRDILFDHPLLKVTPTGITSTRELPASLLNVYGLSTEQLRSIFYFEEEISKKDFIFKIKSIISQLKKGEIETRGTIILKGSKITIE